jgi:hypothetical protein
LLEIISVLILFVILFRNNLHNIKSLFRARIQA